MVLSLVPQAGPGSLDRARGSPINLVLSPGAPIQPPAQGGETGKGRKQQGEEGGSPWLLTPKPQPGEEEEEAGGEGGPGTKGPGIKPSGGAQQRGLQPAGGRQGGGPEPPGGG